MPESTGSYIASLFQDTGIEGCIILESHKTKKIYYFNKERLSIQYSPASTFKILNTLIAVHESYVSGSGHKFIWDGTTHPIAGWNQNHTLKSAFQVSCVWCYQELARSIGKEIYKQTLTSLPYGTLREPFGVDTFWLDGSLKINAIEQLAFIKNVYYQKLPFRIEAYQVLSEIMLDSEIKHYKLYGKTGWAARQKPQIGWYTGYAITKDDVIFFAMNLNIEKEDQLSLRREITLKALSKVLTK